MRRSWFVIWWALAAVLTVEAQEATASGSPTRIFALNLFALPMDVQWGDDGAYRALGLFSRVAAKGALVEPGQPRSVLFQRAGMTAWSTAKGPDGKAALVSLDAGGTYVLVVRSNGNGELVKTGSPATAAPKVLFVNAAKGPVAQLRLGVNSDGQAPGFGDFVDAVAGVQTLTWSWPTMPPGTDVYRASSAQPGQPGTTKLIDGHWYIAVVSAANGQVFDVTPQ